MNLRWFKIRSIIYSSPL